MIPPVQVCPKHRQLGAVQPVAKRDAADNAELLAGIRPMLGRCVLIYVNRATLDLVIECEALRQDRR
jgi:hypothetical protein